MHISLSYKMIEITGKVKLLSSDNVRIQSAESYNIISIQL